MKMKKQVRMISMKKRAIAFLMAFAMVMSLLPGTAVWAGEVEDSSGDASENKTIEATAADVNVPYDGKEHGIEVTVIEPAEGATIKYGVTKGEYNLEKSPTYKEIGENTVYYKVTAPGYSDLEQEVKVTITKATQSNAKVEMTGYVYGGPVNEPKIKGAEENPEITYYYSSENKNEGGTEWANAEAASLPVGTYYIYAKLEATTHYGEYTTETEEFQVTGRTIEVEADHVNVPYNGEEHGIKVTVKVPVEGATIKYGVTKEEYNLEKSPTYKEIGENTVYYKVTAPGYSDLEQEVKVTITKATQSNAKVEMTGYVYGGPVNEPKIKGAEENPEITYYYSSENKNEGGTEWANAEAASLPVGTYYIYAKLEATTHYGEYTTETEEFQVTGKTIEVEAYNVNVPYDGKEHGIEVIVKDPVEGATVKYGTKPEEYNLTENPQYCNANEYTVYYQVTAENYNTVEGVATVKIEKAIQGDITVAMENYERGGKSIPSINKPDTIKEDAPIKFYYNTSGDTSGGTLWAENNSSKIAAGNYYIYAVLGETTNYKEYRTKAVGFTVYAGHSLGKGVVTKKRTDSSEGELTYTCEHGCGYTKKLPLPKKVVTVELGKKAKIISDISACTMKLPNASKYKKYLTLDTKKGIIKTKKYYKVKLKKSIPVNVVVDGVTYKVNVKVKIPTPEVKISKGRPTPMSDGSKAYKYSFTYNIKGADSIKVRMKKGGTKKLNREFDYYISKPKSNKMSYVLFSKKTLKKLKNKVTFKITVSYGKGKNKLELPAITRSIE